MDKTCNTLIVAAPGGHGVVAKQIARGLNQSNLVVLTNLKEKWFSKRHGVTHITESNRDYKILFQLVIAFILIIQLKPKNIISTGAGVAVPFFLAGKLLGTKNFYVESQTHTKKLSLTGKLSYYLVDKIIVRSSAMESKKKIISII